MADLLNIELHHDSLKQFEAWGEMQVPVGIMDEELLGYLYERQLRQSTLMKDALSFFHWDFFLCEVAEELASLRALVKDILEGQNIIISFFF